MENFVEEFQEFQDQKRIFGSILSDLNDSSLFFKDTVGNENIKTPRLRIDEIIAQKSRIPSILSRNAKASFKVLENGKKISKNLEKKIKKISARITKVENPSAKNAKNAKSAKSLIDPWTQKIESAQLKASYKSENYLDPIENVKKPELPKVEKSAIEVSHPGSSYNPDKKDHETLIQLAYQEEMVKIAQKEKIDEKLDFPHELKDLDDDMTKELLSDSESEVTEVVQDLQKKIKKRKTRVDRNKELKEAARMKKQLEEMQSKKLNKDINIIKEIEKELQVTKNKRKHVKDIGKTTLGPYKFRKMSIEVQLSDEISENLRKFKPEGNLFKDRFLDFQKKKMIETRLPVSLKRRYKLKETESHDYKRFK